MQCTKHTCTRALQIICTARTDRRFWISCGKILIKLSTPREILFLILQFCACKAAVLWVSRSGASAISVRSYGWREVHLLVSMLKIDYIWAFHVIFNPLDMKNLLINVILTFNRSSNLYQCKCFWDAKYFCRIKKIRNLARMEIRVFKNDVSKVLKECIPSTRSARNLC